MTDKQRADIYAAFLKRLYIYRNVTLDNNRVQLWLSKLDDWGRGCDTESQWEDVMANLLMGEGGGRPIS